MIEKIGEYETFTPFGKSLAKINELIEVVNTLTEQKKEVKEEWPRKGDSYWFINETGAPCISNVTGDYCALNRGEFMGVYKTKLEAEAMAAKIKQFVKEQV